MRKRLSCLHGIPLNEDCQECMASTGRRVIKRDGVEMHLKTESGGDGPPLTTLDGGDTVHIGGDHITIVDHPDGSATISFDDKGTGRVCGGCTLCCKLIGVASLAKPAGQKCQHSKHGKGCAIYPNRPHDCRTWACRWIADVDTAGMPRPDRCHYVIDMAWETIHAREEVDGPSRPITALQVWVDPAFPDAGNAPELRRFIEHVAEKYGAVTILRFGASTSKVILAPVLMKTGEWHEMSGTGAPDPTDSKRSRWAFKPIEAQP
jgi:hypothetical protein